MKRIIWFILSTTTIILILAYTYLFVTQESISLNDVTRNTASGKFIKLSKGYVHYELKGSSNKPLLVLVGGAGLGYSVWDKNIDTLIQSGYQILRYDHYGRGYSDRISQPHTLELYYQQLTELLDSLHINQAFSLFGLSMGGMVAIKYALAHPTRVNKLVLISPAGINPFRASSVLKTPLLSQVLMTAYWRPKAVRSQMEEFYVPAKFPEYKVALEKQIQIKGYKNAQLSIWLNVLSTDLSKEVKLLGKLNKSVLLIWGRQDNRTLLENSKFYINAIPDLSFLPVDKAGHLSNYERPELVNPTLINFLRGK